MDLLKNIFIIIVLMVILLAGIKTYESPHGLMDTYGNQEQKIDENTSIAGLDGIDYTVNDLTPPMVKFLQTESAYKDSYQRGKKFVISPFSKGGCPYGNAFIDSFNKIRKNEEYNAAYDFYDSGETMGDDTYTTFTIVGSDPKETEDKVMQLTAKGNFEGLCGMFCIVNPSKEKVFSFSGIGPKKAKKLKSIFEQLKNW